ncbi:Ribosomal protein S12 methylthiotransferase accessory factor YcaO, partial [Haemophilus influenzae]
IRGRRFPNLCV